MHRLLPRRNMCAVLREDSIVQTICRFNIQPVSLQDHGVPRIPMYISSAFGPCVQNIFLEYNKTRVCISVLKKEQRCGFQFSNHRNTQSVIIHGLLRSLHILKGSQVRLIIATRPRNCGTFGLMEKVAKIQEARVDECLPKIKEVGASPFHGKSWEVQALNIR